LRWDVWASGFVTTCRTRPRDAFCGDQDFAIQCRQSNELHCDRPRYGNHRLQFCTIQPPKVAVDRVGIDYTGYCCDAVQASATYRAAGGLVRRRQPEDLRPPERQRKPGQVPESWHRQWIFALWAGLCGSGDGFVNGQVLLFGSGDDGLWGRYGATDVDTDVFRQEIACECGADISAECAVCFAGIGIVVDHAGDEPGDTFHQP